LYNVGGAQARLRGGSFTARGGTSYTQAINNSDSGTRLDAEDVVALGENGVNANYGLNNMNSATATLRRGTFTARGGADVHGIRNGYGATLDAEYITALGEDGSDDNYGLQNDGSPSATANITHSVLEGVTSSVYKLSGTVTISNSRLVGGAVNGAGVTCVLVTRGTTVSTDGSTCP
jgi:hypothetical protein